MPQLDLSWFMMKFCLAWTLMLICWMIINNQKWFSQNNDTKEKQNKKTTKTNKWKW